MIFISHQKCQIGIFSHHSSLCQSLLGPFPQNSLADWYTPKPTCQLVNDILRSNTTKKNTCYYSYTSIIRQREFAKKFFLLVTFLTEVSLDLIWSWYDCQAYWSNNRKIPVICLNKRKRKLVEIIFSAETMIYILASFCGGCATFLPSHVSLFKRVCNFKGPEYFQ